MSNLKVKDGDGNDAFIKGSGVGSTIDPLVTAHDAHLGGVPADAGIGTTGTATQRVVLASDQPTVPVSLAASPLPANASQEAGGNLDKLIAAQNSIAAALRVRNLLAVEQILQVQGAGGFVPIEVPLFLGGL